jgi:hypothetical protein
VEFSHGRDCNGIYQAGATRYSCLCSNAALQVKETMNRYLRHIDTVLRRRSINEIREIAFLMVVIISVAAYLLGYEITTSTFFLIPIALATWYGNYRQGVYFALLSHSFGT